MAVGYATSNRGACHLTGASYFEKTAVKPEFGYEKPRPRYTEGGEALMNFHTQNLMGIMDSLKMCKFTIYGGGLTEICEWYEAGHGSKTPWPKIWLWPWRGYSTLKGYITYALAYPCKDDIPERILNDAEERRGDRKLYPDLEPMLGEYYEIRGWDRNGIPKRETVERLGLDRKYF